jgi:outer membrane autotransporter protein
MKPRKILVLACSMLLLASSTAYSANSQGGYVSGNIGVAMPSSTEGQEASLDYDTGYSVGGAVGYDFGKVRIEGELQYQKTDTESVSVSEGITSVSLDAVGDISVTSFLVNGYFDIENDTKFTPFLSAGAGYASGEMKYNLNVPGSGVFSVSTDFDGFAYQLGAGCSYSVSDSTEVELKYRYFVPDEDFKSHNVTVGVRVNF